MSDDQETDDSTDQPPMGQEQMTNRLASLRASIRASKQRKTDELSDATPTTEARAPEPSGEASEAPEAVEQFDAAETQSLASDELGLTAPATETPSLAPDFEQPDELEARIEPGVETPEESEAPPRPMRKSGEAFITGDLHRVRPSEEAVLGDDEASLFDQMDQASEAAQLEEATGQDAPLYDVDPTIIQRLDDLRFVQGTPLYMSPEQCRNDDAGPETDVYSLGVMLFELLEGFPPYMAETVEEVIFKHLDAPVPKQRAEFTPPEVRDLVHRMLAKDPAERPSTTEIIEVLQGHVTLAGPDVHGLEEESWSVVEIAPEEHVAARAKADRTGDAAKPAKKGPPWLIFGAVAAVLLLCGALFAMMSGGGDEVVDDPVATPTQQPEPEPEPVAALDPPEEPEPEEPSMEFEPAAVPDAGASPVDAGKAEVEPVVEEPLVEEPVVEEPPKPKKKKKKRRKRRRKKKKKDELRELRLDL